MTNFRFLDANGALVSDGSQDSGTYTALPAIQGSLAPLFPPAGQYMYVPYMATPGNLLSYTVESIGATMNTLTGGAIPNYFETIIWPGAFTFMSGTSSAQKYLDFA